MVPNRAHYSSQHSSVEKVDSFQQEPSVLAAHTLSMGQVGWAPKQAEKLSSKREVFLCQRGRAIPDAFGRSQGHHTAK